MGQRNTKMNISKSDFMAIKRKVKTRKSKRIDNAKFIAKISKRPRKPSIKSLRKKLWDTLTRYVRRRDGPLCRICKLEPGYALFHLVPQNEGNAVRYDPLNVVWGCRSCNCAEVNHRARYARKFEEMFGKEYMDALWTKSRIIPQFRRPDWERMIAEVEAL